MKLSCSGRVALTRLFCLLVLCAPLAAVRAAEATPPVATDSAADSGSPAPSPAPDTERFGLRIDAPEALRSFLLRHAELQRYRTLEDLDSGELDRLLLTAPDNLRQLLGTQGHFSPQIAIERTLAVAGGPALGEVHIRVDPGPLTRVASAQVHFLGDVAAREDAAAQREAITRRASETIGQPFTQSGWSALKSESLRQLSSERYPRARIDASLSDIDSLQQAANWTVVLDSGAPVRIGEVRVEGAQRYDPLTVQRIVRLSGLGPGADYSLSRLQDAQQRIADTGYYGSVYAYVDLDTPDEESLGAPVVVQVREAPLKKLVLGVGGSTNSGPRLSAEHTHLRLPGLGWQALTKLQLEREDQSFSSDWTAPVKDNGWHWLASGRLARQIDEPTTTTSQRLSLGQSKNSQRTDLSRYVQYDRALTSHSSSGEDSSAAAISLNHGWTWRRFDRLPYPRDGYGLGLTLGLGTTLGGERKPFATAQARWLTYWSLDAVPQWFTNQIEDPRDTGRLGRLALRLQGGAVLADADAPIPDSQLFLTGGDNTVRGYGLRDIGIEQDDGSVKPGRYMAVASFEWQRPIWRQGVRSDWESVLFADAGLITNQPAHTSPKIGVGAGLRYNSPVGPLQFDLAYGVATKRLRLHINVGFSF